MTSFIDKIIRLLSDKRVTIAIIAIAILSRLIQLIYYYTIAFDPSYQVIAMHNFISGHGITISQAIPADIGTTIYQPLINWPPGYSLLLAPFYLLFDQNYIAAGLTLDIIAAIVLIIACRGILKTLSVPLYLVNLFTLFSGFYIYRFYLIASSDAIAVSIFLVAIYFTLKLFKQPGRWLSKTILITICLFICSTLKYLFVPVVFIVPALLIIIGFSDRISALKKAGLFSFALLAIIIGGLLLWQQSLSGTMGYVSAPGRGFYPAHLLTAYPFIPAAFLQPGTMGILVNQPSETGDPLYCLFQWIHAALFMAIFIYTAGAIWKTKFRNLSLNSRFYYLSFFLCLSIPLVLAFLSIRVEKEEIVPGYFWTYIEELRYYGLATILLHLGLFVLYTHYRPPIRFNRPRAIWAMLLVVLLLPELARGMIFDLRRIMLARKEEYTWQYEYRFQQYADNIIKKEQQKHPIDNIVVTGSSHYMNNRIAVYSHAAVLTDNMIVNELSAIKANRPALLLVMLYEKEFAAFQPFLAAKGNEVAGYFGGLYFYTVYVTPR